MKDSTFASVLQSGYWATDTRPMFISKKPHRIWALDFAGLYAPMGPQPFLGLGWISTHVLITIKSTSLSFQSTDTLVKQWIYKTSTSFRAFFVSLFNMKLSWDRSSLKDLGKCASYDSNIRLLLSLIKLKSIPDHFRCIYPEFRCWQVH